MPDFKALLNRKIDDAKKPDLLPAGVYEGVVMDYAPIESNTAEKTLQVRINVRLTGATEDVDEADLINQEGKEIKIADRRMRHDFWMDPENEWKLGEFIKTCGVDTAGRGFGETLPELKNAPVFVTVNRSPDKVKKNEDGTPVEYNNIVRLVGQAGANG